VAPENLLRDVVGLGVCSIVSTWPVCTIFICCGRVLGDWKRKGRDPPRDRDRRFRSMRRSLAAFPVDAWPVSERSVPTTIATLDE
jgi:hypothetical protein